MLKGQPIDRLTAGDCSRWSKSNAGIEVLCAIIFWMDGELKRLTLGMMVSDELKKEAERFFSISLPLVVAVDKEVEDPVVVQAPWLSFAFRKSHHLPTSLQF